MPRARTTLLVGNPTARSGKAAEALALAMGALEAAGLAPELVPTLPDGGTIEAVASRIEREDVARVVYLGGDGTFAEAAKGILLARDRSGVDVPLGMLPMGTANNQGRSFGIAAGLAALERNVAIIGEGLELGLDVGRIEAWSAETDTSRPQLLRQDLFFDSAGMGLSAEILETRNRDREVVEQFPLLSSLYRDHLVYAGATLRSLVSGMFAGKTFGATLRVDDRVIEVESCTDLIVLDTILYGGEWVFAPESRPDDGRFELVIVRSHGDWVSAAISHFKQNPVLAEDLEELGFETTAERRPAGRHIEIDLHRPSGLDAIPSQIDGEEWVASDRYVIEALFQHLRVIVPEDPRWI
jgi:diacylglycerol kinase family enzyme